MADSVIGIMDGNNPSRDDVHAELLELTTMAGSADKRDVSKIRTAAVLEEDFTSPLSESGPSDRQKMSMQHNRRLAVDLGFYDAPLSLCIRAKRLLRNTWCSLKMIRLFLSLAWTDVKTRTCSYCLGFFSVLVVVMLCVLMISLLTNMPILFLRLSEASRGEYDLRIGPAGGMTAATSLNYTIIQELFPASDANYGLHAARILDVFNAQKVSTCPGKNASSLWYALDGSLCSGEEECMEECSAVDWTPVNLVAVDTAAERRMGFGTSYSQPTPKAGEIILSHRASLLMGGVTVGDVIALYGDARGNLQQAFINFSGNGTTDAIMVFTVISVMDRDDRKFPSLTSFAVVNYHTYLTDVAKGLRPDTSKDDVAAVAGTDPNDCASFVYFIMEPYTRLRAYRSTRYNTIRRHVVAWASRILSPLGFMQIGRQTPQLWGLWSTRMMSVFLGLIVSVILLALAFLSIVLIYTLLTVGVETKTYELGIQRMIGFTKENLVVLVLANAYSFTIPAWIIGLAAGQGVYAGIRQLFISLIDVTLPLRVSGASVGWATLAGLGIPIVASFFPILALVTQKLPDALNTSRSRSVGVVFKIRRNDTSELNGSMFGLGLLLFVFGFLIYYLFPTGLIVMNLSLIFYIFFAVLIGLLAGLVLLALNFERVCQVCVSYLLLFWESKAVFSFMQKSLSAHRRRNRKTTLMYSLSLAFVVFITVAVQIELTSFEYTTRQELGCEVYISTDSLTWREYWTVEEYLDTYIKSGYITGYTYDYVTTGLTHTGSQTLNSLGRYRGAGATVSPLPPNYYEVLDSTFLLINKVNALVEQYGLVQSLYTAQGMRKGIMSSGTATYLGAGDAKGVLLFSATQEMNRTSHKTAAFITPARPIAAMDLTPVQSMSKYLSDWTPWIVSIPDLLYLIKDPYSSVQGGTVTYIRLRVKNARTYKAIGDTMTSILSSLGHTAAITTITEKTEDMATANNILNIFFIMAELMILVICFFSLMSSMTTNVLDSSKEIGVLLCMGMTRFQVYRVYVWEAFILVVSSGIVGLIVGVVVAYTMLLQQILFSQMSFPFPFPYVQLCIVVVVGVVSALASSISPVAYLLGLPSVTHILRRSIT
jgi:ABC-type antimicrobial peptide transport system permease subunit